MAPRIRITGSPITKEFLEELAVKDESGCWLWPRAIGSHGYGVLRIGRGRGKARTMHRLAWEVWNGPIPNGLCVLHRCDVRRCYNPEHLFLGTLKDNTQDALSKGRLLVGEDHPDAILTSEQVLEIRRRYKAGERNGDLSDAFGVGRPAISGIVKRRTWKHLP